MDTSTAERQVQVVDVVASTCMCRQHRAKMLSASTSVLFQHLETSSWQLPVHLHHPTWSRTSTAPSTSPHHHHHHQPSPTPPSAHPTHTCDHVWVCLQHQAGPALQQVSFIVKRHHLQTSTQHRPNRSTRTTATGGAPLPVEQGHARTR